MAEKKSVPQIRFAGYFDEWVKYQFGNILDKYEDPIATPYDGYERLGVRSHAKGTFHSYVAPGSELETAQMHRVAANKMLFNITFAWEHAVAITDELDAGKLVSHRFPQFTFDPKMEPKFFKYVIADEKFRYHLWLSSPGGAGRNRVLNIPEMLEYQTYLPKKSEQIRLAGCFSHLDGLIGQHQSKYKKLQAIKASMLDKMFPKDGSDVPEVRFKGFTDAWEQRKFFELYERVSQKNDLTFGKDDIISVANMYFKPDLYITDPEYLRTYNVFRLGNIAFEGNKSKYFAHGRFVENTIGDGIVSHVFDVFRPIAQYDLLFWKYAINNERIMGKILLRSTKASTMMTNLVANDFLQESIYVPSVAEQQRIGAFFDHLDHLITLHQRELEKLQSLKKSQLEKKFV